MGNGLSSCWAGAVPAIWLSVGQIPARRQNGRRWENDVVTTDLVARARAGDEQAFRDLVEPYRRELQLHCYRFLGSVQDAEDALQETLLAAWQGLHGFAAEQDLVKRLTRAYESGDVNELVALLADDVLMAMPPIPLEYQGRDLVSRFLTAVVFQPGTEFRMIATRANGQPAFGVYLLDLPGRVARANGLLVFTLAGDRVSAITRFGGDVLPRFGLPATLPS
jgi:hypothetical protein